MKFCYPNILSRAYPFPDNMRELKNILEHEALLSRGNVMQSAHLPDEICHRTNLRQCLPHAEDRTIISAILLPRQGPVLAVSRHRENTPPSSDQNRP